MVYRLCTHIVGGHALIETVKEGGPRTGHWVEELGFRGYVVSNLISVNPDFCLILTVFKGCDSL